MLMLMWDSQEQDVRIRAHFPRLKQNKILLGKKKRAQYRLSNKKNMNDCQPETWVAATPPAPYCQSLCLLL